MVTSLSVKIDDEKSLFVLSDLHIRENDQGILSCLLRFVGQRTHRETVLLVGDIFDLCIGSLDHWRRSYSSIIDAIYEANERGVQIFFVEGNHDFHMDQFFKPHPNLHVIRDDLYLQWCSYKIKVVHGDRIRPWDYSYGLFRWSLKNSVTEYLLSSYPSKTQRMPDLGKWLDRFGLFLADQSRKRHPYADEKTVLNFRRYSEKCFQEGVDRLVMGHSHHFEDYRVSSPGQRAYQYINCGFPPKDRRYFMATPSETFFQSRILALY